MRRVAALALAGALCSCGRAGDLVVEDAWVRTAPPGTAVQAGYLSLHNPAQHAVTVVGARSDAFGRVEIHESSDRHGVRAMRRIERLDVPAGGRAALEPGGLHLMLMEPVRHYRRSERVGIVLILADGREHGFAAELRDDAP